MGRKSLLIYQYYEILTYDMVSSGYHRIKVTHVIDNFKLLWKSPSIKGFFSLLKQLITLLK